MIVTITLTITDISTITHIITTTLVLTVLIFVTDVTTRIPTTWKKCRGRRGDKAPIILAIVTMTVLV